MTIAKLMIVFTAMVILLMRRVNLGAVMAGASCLLGLLFALSPAAFGQVVLVTVATSSNLYLLLALVMIMVMEEILQHEGSLRRMVLALRRLIGSPGWPQRPCPPSWACSLLPAGRSFPPP